MVDSGRNVGAGRDAGGSVARELREETGLTVRVIELIECLIEFIWRARPEPRKGRRARFHYVIVDYLCNGLREAVAGSDVTEVAFASEEELGE